METGFRFIHAADLHLDSPFRGVSDAPETVAAGLRESTFAALRNLTELAIAEEADFIVLSGDLYDAADRSLRAQLALCREWQELGKRGIQVFVIHGNHDPLSGARAQLELPGTVTVFGASAPEGRPAFRRDGTLAAYVYGISYETRSVTDNLASRYVRRSDGFFHIAMLHANVDGHPAHDPYAPCKLDELAGAGFDYWALGHIHERKVLHEYPHVVYPGNTQGRNPRETGEKGCYIVDVSASREVKLTFVPLDTIRWVRSELDIGGLASEQQAAEAMFRLAEQAAASHRGRNIMLKLVLIGRGVLHPRFRTSAALADLSSELRERLSGLHDGTWIWAYALEAATAAELNDGQLLEEDSFAGELYRLVNALNRNPERREAFIGEALTSLAEHPKLRRLMKDRDAGSEDRWDRAAALALEWLTAEEADEVIASSAIPETSGRGEGGAGR
ncbi:exonuclease SbcCD subunit D [Paenibacillus tarimensis]